MEVKIAFGLATPDEVISGMISDDQRCAVPVETSSWELADLRHGLGRGLGRGGKPPCTLELGALELGPSRSCARGPGPASRRSRPRQGPRRLADAGQFSRLQAGYDLRQRQIKAGCGLVLSPLLCL